MRPLAISCGLAALSLIAGAPASSGARGGARRARAPAHVTSDTRAELDARMRRHGVTMSSLVRAVVLLDRPNIRLLAMRIADEEIVARADAPPPARRLLELPRAYFAEQDKLTQAARELAAAAVEGSEDEALANRFAALTRSCVTCHSVVVHSSPELQPFGPNSR